VAISDILQNSQIAQYKCTKSSRSQKTVIPVAYRILSIHIERMSDRHSINKERLTTHTTLQRRTHRVGSRACAVPPTSCPCRRDATTATSCCSWRSYGRRSFRPRRRTAAPDWHSRPLFKHIADSNISSSGSIHPTIAEIYSWSRLLTPRFMLPCRSSHRPRLIWLAAAVRLLCDAIAAVILAPELTLSLAPKSWN